MAFYDDGGVQFAEKQFAESRARKEKEAKKQDKFTKNILVLDGLLGLGDNILNKKADKLQNEGVLARSHYLSSLENSNVFNKQMNQDIQDGLNTEDILYNETKDKLITYTQELYGEGYDISQFMDGITNIARETSKDVTALEKYQEVIDAHAKIPTMSPAEFIAYSREQEQPPRNVGAFLGNKVKKIFNSHDEETLSEEDKIGKQKILNGMLGENFASVKKAVEEYAKLGNPIDELADFITKNPDLIAFKNVTTEIKPETIMRNGKTTVTNYIISSAQSSDGRIVELSPPIPTTSSTKDAETPVYNAQALSIGSAKINEWAKETLRNVEETMKDDDLEENFKYAQKHFPTLLTESVLTIQDNLINNYGESKSKALGIAIRYAVNQENSEIDTNPSLFDIDLANGVPNTDDILKYSESIKAVKGDVFIPNELKVMRDRLVNIVATADVSDSEKEEEIKTIYKIMDEKYDIVPPNKFNEIATNKNENLTKEEKTLAQKINDLPVIGPVNEFLFDESYDKMDALVFLGGVGLGRTIGVKVIGTATKKAAVKIGGKILSSPKMSAFIKKASKYIDPNSKASGRGLFLKNMNPIQRAIFKSMDPKGKVDTVAFMKRQAKLPGTKIVQSGVLPGIGTKIGMFTYGALGAYAYFSSSPTENKEYDLVDLDKDEG